MPDFRFKAMDAAGHAQAGTTSASTASNAVEQLRQRGWLVLEVTGEPTHGAGRHGGMSLTGWLPVRSLDVEVSLNQIAAMLRGGLTLLSAIATVSRQAQRPAMSRIWEQIAEDIQEGDNLADALQRHRCFGQMVVQMIRVGEQSGTLEQVLARAAQSLEARRLLRANLLTALAYPAVVLIAAVGVTAFMIVYLIPKLEKFLASLHKELPWSTQFLLDVSHIVNAYWVQTTVVVITLALAATAFYSWRPGRLWTDRMLLRLPMIGYVLRLAGTTGFARAMAILIGSGITITESLRTSERLLGNRHLADVVANTRQAVLQGGSLAESLDRRGAFMPMLAGMVDVGETSGSLEDSFDEVAQFHDQQLQSAIRRLSIIVEPVIVVVVGSIVGFVYISFFMALLAGAA